MFIRREQGASPLAPQANPQPHEVVDLFFLRFNFHNGIYMLQAAHLNNKKTN